MENRVKILIADGNEEFCGHLKRALEQSGGYEVVGIAGDGEQALALLSAQEPDVLVLDLLLAAALILRALGRITWIKRRSRSFYPAS